ncbi:hypothetical protein CHARACLAT_019810 [Characodon lateralis]|uniref:Uncharacterized protein n=1 Tax=Characodon lateralis TaxID=208331 RepID=A0ABU7F4T0_9TELE|nr:hypothetical protein [Characodon lateralis]
MGESPDWPQGAPGSEADSVLGRSPLLSPAMPQLAPGAQLRDCDLYTAAGLFEAYGIAGCNLTNRRNYDGSKPKRLHSGLGAQPEERASRSAPGLSASERAHHPRSDSSWGPHRGTRVAVWLSGRIYQSQRRPPCLPPEPPSPGTPTMTPPFRRLLWQR